MSERIDQAAAKLATAAAEAVVAKDSGIDAEAKAAVAVSASVDLAEARALDVHEAIKALWKEDVPESVTRDKVTIVFDAPPAPLLHPKTGQQIGVDALVRAFDADGKELEIDPHRRFFNPPTRVLDGGTETVEVEVRPGKTETVERPTYVEDPWEAYLQCLFDSIRVAPAPEGWRTKGTVDTIYGDAADGTLYGNNATYATARSTCAGVAGELTGAGTVGQFQDPDFEDFSVWVYYPGFDTSPIGTDTVSSAVLSIKGNGDNSDTNFTINARLRDWGATLTTGDWVAGASLSGVTPLLAHFTLGSWGAGYNDFTDDAMPANINGAGYTRMLLCSSREESGSAPSFNSEYVSLYTASYTGTSNDPKLTITHTAGGGTTPVSNSVACDWNVRAAVAQSVTSDWNIRTSVTATKDSTWNVLVPVAQTVVSTWNILTTLSSPATAVSTWNIRAQITATKDADWNIRTPVVQSVASTWNISEAVSQSVVCAWNIQAAVVKATVCTWNILTTVAQTRVCTWDVLTPVSQSADCTWNLRQIITTTVVSEWSLSGQVTSSGNCAWNVRALVTQTKQVDWNDLVPIASDATVDSQWNIFVAVTQDVVLEWNLVGRLLITYLILWNVIGVPTTPVTNWRKLRWKTHPAYRPGMFWPQLQICTDLSTIEQDLVIARSEEGAP